MESKTEKIEPEHTHKATLTITSNGDDESVSVRVQWEPNLSGDDIKALGFMPASFKLMDEYVWPAIEEAYKDYFEDPMMNSEPASSSIN